MASGGFSICIKDNEYTQEFILGLMNSKLLFWYLSKLSNKFRGGWITCTKQYIGRLPIKVINEENKMDVKKIGSLVSTIISLNNKETSTKTPQEKTALQRQIEATDKQIDQLVYQLYDLTEEEIKIVEGE